MTNATGYSAVSTDVGNKTITILDLGTGIQIAIAGFAANIHPGRILKRARNENGRPVRFQNFTEDGAIALFLLLEQTACVKAFLARREARKGLVRHHLLKRALYDPKAPDWECG
ncbi:MAG: hypothetical protein AAB473_03765 [Patescibacteria group bacterium]